MSKPVNEELLRSGKILLYLKEQFLKNRSKETLFPLLNCLRDSKVIVPVSMAMSQKDAEKFANSKAGDTVTASDPIRFRPDILKKGEKCFLPIFSNKEQIPNDYRENFSTISVTVLQCLEMAKKNEKICGLVLDAYTTPVVLEYPIADLIPKFESKLK